MATQVKPTRLNILYPSLVSLIFLVLVARTWHDTWDDSAITLAFARNLALYGDIVSSPLSGRVEGSSTFLWMILHAAFFSMGWHADAVLNLAKSLATAFTLLNFFLFWQIASNILKTSAYRWLALSLFAFASPTLSAAVDGMETSLYATLLLTSYLTWQKRKFLWTGLAFGIISPFLILIRHEGAIFLLPFVALIAIQQPRRFFLQPHFYVWALVFLVYHTWHYFFFGEMLTNPMLAKRHAPYHPGYSDFVLLFFFYLAPFLTLIQTYLFAFLYSLVVWVWRWNRKMEPALQQDTTLIRLLAFTGILLTLVTGSNFGAAIRLSYPAQPFLIILLFSAIDFSQPFRLPRPLQWLAALLASLHFFTVSIPALSAQLPHEISLRGVEELASAVTTVQTASGQTTLTYAGADMGGLLLYHADHKKVIDLGLLCDRELAKNGYQNYETYLFDQQKPEVIEAHAFWLEPLLEIPRFFEEYKPVLVKTPRREQLLYLRSDFLAKIALRYPIQRINTPVSPSQTPTDRALQTFGYYFLLDLR